MHAIARVPGRILRFFGRLARKIALGIAGIASLAALLVVLDAVLLRDRSGRPPG